MEIGAVADWVNAGGTLLTFAGAVFAGVVAWKSYRSQSATTERQLALLLAEEGRRRERERRDQADKIAVWIYRGRFRWNVRTVNASNLPVFRLVVLMRCDEPAFSVAVGRGTQGPDDLGPSTKLTNALETVLSDRDAMDVDSDTVHIDISFTDAAGVRWLRTEDGRLREVDESFEFPDADERLVDRLIPMREEEQRRRGLEE